MAPVDPIEEFLARSIGLDPSSLGMGSMDVVVNSILESKGVKNKEEYLQSIEDSPDEMAGLIERVVVPETWFFRDHQSFAYLKKYLEGRPAVAERNSVLRVLSSPCSTGEEPYSIAMTLLEAGLSKENAAIDAVDISGSSLKTAKNGIYKNNSFREKIFHRMGRYFSESEGRLHVCPEVSASVTFHQDNMVKTDFMAYHESYDIVFCKNLLIYLTDDGRRKVLANIERLLKPEGILFVGNSEVMYFLQNGYESVQFKGSFACKRLPSAEKVKSFVTVRQEKTPAKQGAGGRIVGRIVSDKERAAPIKGQLVTPPAGSVFERARRLADRGELCKAGALCEKAIQEEGDSKEIYYLLGLICQATARQDEAEGHLQRALYMDPFYYDALIHMSLLFAERGEKERAQIFKDRAKRAHEREGGAAGAR